MEVEALFGVDGYVLVMAYWKSSKCHNEPTAFNGGGGAGNDYNDLSGAGDFIQFEEISFFYVFSFKIYDVFINNETKIYFFLDN